MGFKQFIIAHEEAKMTVQLHTPHLITERIFRAKSFIPSNVLKYDVEISFVFDPFCVLRTLL